MKLTTHHGFEVLEHKAYTCGSYKRLIQPSSAIGDYPNSFRKPGSSFLWIGKDHHLNREQVKEVVSYLQNWLKTGELT